MNLDIEQRNKVLSEISSLSAPLANEVLKDLDTACQKLDELLQDTSIGNQECNKIYQLNRDLLDLQSDTTELLNTIKSSLASDANVSS